MTAPPIPEALPAPLVPADVDLSDFAFMPVETDRLLKSMTWVLGDGEARAAAMTLWLQSWHEMPAGSLPDNDKMLAHLSMSKNWRKVKEHALRGWVLSSDGRRYHAVVCEKVLESWIEKLLAAISGATGNAKRWQIEVSTQAMRAQLVAAAACLRSLAPASRTLKKKAVMVIISESPAESGGDDRKPSGGDVAGESGGDPPKASGGDRKGQGQGQGQGSITPNSPQKPKPRGAKAGPIGLKAWLEAERVADRRAVPEGDPVFAYADEAGIPREFLALAWAEFRTIYTSTRQGKRYRDWRHVFRNAVRGNWLKLWYVAQGGAYALTTAGEQARKAAKERAARTATDDAEGGAA